MLSHFFRNLPLQNIRILAGTNKTVILKDNLINQWYLTLDIVFLTSITVVTTDVEMLFRDFGQYFSYNKLPTKSVTTPSSLTGGVWVFSKGLN